MNKKDLIAKIVFMEKMGHLLDAGVPLFKSLQMLQREIENPNAQNAIGKLIAGIEKQGDNFKFEEWLDNDYFRESEKTMIVNAAKGGRPDRAFLVIAQWLGKELLSEK